MPAKKKSIQKQVYQLKVTLRDVRPPIWRRFQVTSDITLCELHQILQSVMGWTNSHLYELYVAGTLYGDSEVMEGEVMDDRTVRVGRVITEEGERFLYRYDLGDSWEHDILIEKILPLGEGVRYPLCIVGERACPPEDCGGVTGYEALLEALKDPSHPDHEEKFDWLPGDFDSEKFDVELVNRALRGFP